MGREILTTVILIDSSFTRQSPSARAFVDWVSQECSDQEQARSEIKFEIWAKEIEPELKDRVCFTPLVWRGRGRILSLLVSAGEVLTRYFSDKLRGKPGNRVFISNGFLFSFADLVSVHFSGMDWFLKSFRLGFAAPQAVSGTLRAAIVVGLDGLFHWSPVPNRLVAVSEGVRKDLIRFAAPWKSVKVIPNLSPPAGFSPAAREKFRPQVRQRWGQVKEDEKVLAFCSLGHLRRKGFWVAVDAVAQARSLGARLILLVIGVEKKNLREKLSEKCPNWEEFIRFTGAQQDVRIPLSACDGYLFPSYSEAFSLTEIEAAALGLRLYLTPHHGVEMFDSEHFHGRILPWEAKEIGDLLFKEWEQGKVQAGPSSPNGALSTREFGECWMREIEYVLFQRGKRTIQ